MKKENKNFYFGDLVKAVTNNQTNRRDYWFMLFGAILSLVLSLSIPVLIRYTSHYLVHLLTLR